MNFQEFNNLAVDIKKFDVENEILWFYVIEKNGAIVVPVAKNKMGNEFFDLRTKTAYFGKSPEKALKKDYFVETDFSVLSSTQIQQSMSDVCTKNQTNQKVFDAVNKNCTKEKQIAFPVFDEKSKKQNRFSLIKKADAMETIFAETNLFVKSQEKNNSFSLN